MKGEAIFRLLTILQEETDEQHRLSQQALAERMEQRFGISMNRRTLKSYLDELIAVGYPLNATAKQRILPDGAVETMLTDWYLEPQFEISELRILCDLLAAMPAIPESQRNALTEKVMKLAPPTFQQSHSGEKITYLHIPPAQQMLYTIEQLCEAIRKNCMVSFQYGSFVLDQDNQPVLQPRMRENGTIREYLVSPYEIVVSHGRYYLICCKEPYREISHYRIDRIKEMKLMEDFESLPLSETNGSEYPKQLAEQLYMYSGATEEITFLADTKILGDILDWFGTDVRFKAGEKVNTVEATVHVHPTAMTHWALQYGKYVTILQPESLRDEIIATAQTILNKYGN